MFIFHTRFYNIFKEIIRICLERMLSNTISLFNTVLFYARIAIDTVPHFLSLNFFSPAPPLNTPLIPFTACVYYLDKKTKKTCQIYFENLKEKKSQVKLNFQYQTTHTLYVLLSLNMFLIHSE